MSQKPTASIKGHDLTITLHEAAGDIRGRQVSGGPSTWCRITVGSCDAKSRIAFSQTRPVWDQTFRLHIPVLPDGYGGIAADPDVELQLALFEWVPRDYRSEFSEAKAPDQIAVRADACAELSGLCSS